MKKSFVGKRRRKSTALPSDFHTAQSIRLSDRRWQEFVARMLDQIEGACGENQTWREQAESMEQRAERIVSEGLRQAR
jgi:hypothetical protein